VNGRDVFVKVFRDPVTFPAFGLNHSVVHAGKGFFRPLALCNILLFNPRFGENRFVMIPEDR